MNSMNKKSEQNIKISIEYTDGWTERFTAACIDEVEKRRNKEK